MIIRRRFNVKNVLGALRETVDTTAMIFLIMIGANIFGNFLSATGLPQAMSAFCINAQIDRFWILLACLAIYAFLGCFVDSLPLIV